MDEQIGVLLQKEMRPRRGFARVPVTAGDDPAAAEDNKALGLVILDARFPHAGRGATDTEAMKAAADVLERRGSSQRDYRNVLLFAAPDEGRLADARTAVRKLMAWSQIVKRADRELQLPPAQKTEAVSRETEAMSAAQRAIRGAWAHLIIPIKPDEGRTGSSRGYALHAAPIQNSGGEKTVAEAAYDKAVREGAVAEKLGAPILKMALDRLIGDQPHITVRDLAEWSAKYVHMKRRRDESALPAIRRPLHLSATKPAHAPATVHGGFDATITLNDHHLAAAGLTGRKAEAVEAVRQAVERMEGAGWIGVDAQYDHRGKGGHNAQIDAPNCRRNSIPIALRNRRRRKHVWGCQTGAVLQRRCGEGTVNRRHDRYRTNRPGRS